ncbi:MAG: hypothetical protein R3E41_06925 [Burkholderiaceae bacterium]
MKRLEVPAHGVGAAVAGGHDLGRGRLHDRQPRAQARVERVADLGGELIQQAFGVGDRRTLGIGGDDVSRRQRRQRDDDERRPADRRGEVAAWIEPGDRAHAIATGA